MNNRARAMKFARTLLSSWGMTMDEDEIQSTSDLALCEAASRFRPDYGASFSTYLYYYIKGALIKSIRSVCCLRTVSLSASCMNRNAEEDLYPQESVDCADAVEMPDRLTYLNELREHCRHIMESLTPLERKVVFEVHVHERPLAQVARRLEYSRGHISEVRGHAFRRIRREFGYLGQEIWPQAA